MKFTAGSMIAMVGIAGSGMRGLARLLADRGVDIIGADAGHNPARPDPELAAYRIVSEAELSTALGGAAGLIYSDAVPSDHPVRRAAQTSRIPELRYSQALGQFAKDTTTVAVAGTHGKSTTTAMLAHILIAAGRDPSVLVGAPVPLLGGKNAHGGPGDLFLVEADEYRDHFLDLAPQHAIVTNIEFDHPDAFENLADVLESFAHFIRLLPPTGILVTSTDTVAAYPELPWPSSLHSIDTAQAPPLELPQAGAHMQHDGWLALSMAQALGVPEPEARKALATFGGVGRRFELLGTYQGVPLISDYGHHPTEIAATLAGAEEKQPDQRMLVIIEPHTVERLAEFTGDFVAALARADGVIIVPTFAPKGRESESGQGQTLLQELQASLKAERKLVWRVAAFDELPGVLDSVAQDFDTIIAFTAGYLDEYLRSLPSVTRR